MWWKAKPFCCVATRHEKPKATYFELLHWVLDYIRLDKQRSVYTPL